MPADELPIFQNWRAWNKVGSDRISEFPLYTDVHITGEKAAAGPYTFYNTLARPRVFGFVAAGLVLRLQDAREHVQPQFKLKTDTSQYHGGTLLDEVAALASLLLGARVAPGGMSRMAGPDFTNDPLGRPVGWNDAPPPSFRPREVRKIAPALLGSRKIEVLSALGRALSLTADQGVAFVRSARLYQDALWLIEQEPELSWLMLVSAIEGIANVWKKAQASPVARLAFAKPELVSILSAKGGNELIKLVAEDFAETLGSTRKFVEFCLEFLPPPPDLRPPDAFQVPWNDHFWSRALKIIYGYRSKALHQGIPFPAPMCEGAEFVQDGGAPTERGTSALAVHINGASWKADDLPVALNLFAQFVRAVLLNWLDCASGPSALSPRRRAAIQRLIASLQAHPAASRTG